MYESKLRLRVFGQDNVSQGSIIRGSRILQLFTDAITEVLVMKGVRIGKLETMDAQFPNVVLSGEYIEVKAIHVRSVSGTWRFQCTAHKVVGLKSNGEGLRGLPDPELIATAVAVAYAPQNPIPLESSGKIVRIRRQKSSEDNRGTSE